MKLVKANTVNIGQLFYSFEWNCFCYRIDASANVPHIVAQRIKEGTQVYINRDVDVIV